MARKSEEMKTKARIAIVGAGKIGRVHMAQAAREGELAGVADPSAEGRQAAEAFGVPWFDSCDEMLARLRPDGVVLATPNRLHAPQALACIAARVPVLVEKPLADTAEAAREVVVAARAAGVALLVGHHRRHNPLIAAARAEIESGAIGRLVAVNALLLKRTRLEGISEGQGGAGDRRNPVDSETILEPGSTPQTHQTH